MRISLNETLDKSLTLLKTEQATIEECLTRYPKHADNLRPLLALALDVSRLPTPRASAATFSAGERRMLAALAEKKRRQHGSPVLRRYARQIGNLLRSKRPFVQWRSTALQWAVPAALALVLVIAGVLLLRTSRETAVPETAAIAQASGEVEILPSDGESRQATPAGAQISAGDQVHTGPLSSATLDLGDGSTVALEAETEVTFVQMDVKQDVGGKVIVLRQGIGRAYYHVEPLRDPDARFEIETPTAIVVVRGTSFAVGVAADGTTQVEVDEGVVDVTAEGSTVSVPEGKTTEVKPKQPPEPIRSKTPVPPGHTKTPQPPGQTKTPQPPGLTKTPQPPGLTKTPQPPGLTKTPQPPGLTKTPQPPGLTKTPQPVGPDGPKPTKKPQPTKKPKPPKP
jgi:hypothetical protein